jgi:hypothetical protein
MRLVMLESPFRHAHQSEMAENILYARAAMKDSLMRGEAPLASHLLYPQPGILSDADPKERQHGIDAGLAWGAIADCHVFYTDRGWSPGMIAALDYCLKNRRSTEMRSLGGTPQQPPPSDLWLRPIENNKETSR